MIKNRFIDANMRKSAADFMSLVRPALEEHLGGAITPIEGKEELSDILKQFDLNGIDAFFLNKRGSLQGIASRISYAEKDYHTFTTRYAYYDRRTMQDNFDCEFAKKIAALRQPEKFLFFPYFTVQAKCSGGQLCYAHLVETAKLISFLSENKDNRKLVGKCFNYHGGTKFYSVKAETLTEHGIEVINIMPHPSEIQARSNLIQANLCPSNFSPTGRCHQRLSERHL